jgi:hypothetical protein
MVRLLLKQLEAAEALSLSVRSLERMRCQGGGPNTFAFLEDALRIEKRICVSGLHAGSSEAQVNCYRSKTMTNQTKPLSETELANHIKACVAEIKKATQHALLRAFEAGELLIQAQKEYGQHGLWKSWLNTNCELSERTAQLYMQLAEGRSKIEAELAKKDGATVADLSLRGALSLLKSGSSNGKSGDGKNLFDAYGNAEKSLLKRLKLLPLDEAEMHSKKTIDELRETVATMRAGAKAKAA